MENEKTISEKIDFLFNKMLPKKFIVFVVCTILVVMKLTIPSEYWEIVKYYMIGGAVISTAGVVTKSIKKD